MEDDNFMKTTMRAFTNDFLAFMGIREDPEEQYGGANTLASAPPLESIEEASFGQPQGNSQMVSTPHGKIQGSAASPFTRIALGYAGTTEGDTHPIVMGVSQRGFYVDPSVPPMQPGHPAGKRRRAEPDDGLFTAPSTKDSGGDPVPSYEPTPQVKPRGRGRGAGGRDKAHPPPLYSKEDGDVEMDEVGSGPNPRGRRQVKQKDTVVIVHRDGRRETVSVDDPRVSKLQEKEKNKPTTGMYAKDKNGDKMIKKDDQFLMQNARRRQVLQTAVRPKPYFTFSVTILQIALFILEMAKSARVTAISFAVNLGNIWNFGGVSTNVIIDLGGKYADWIVKKNEWWRLITPIFLHVSLPHIVFNLLSQVKISMDLERTFGSIRIGLLYILCGVAGNLLSCCFLFDQIQAGASGSIFGQVGMMLVDVFVNWKLLQRPVCNLVVMIIVIILCVLSGMMPGVDNFAHVGGLIVGIVGGFAFMPRLVNRKGRWTRLIVVLITFPILVALFVGLFTLFYGYVAQGNNIDCEWCEQINCASVLLGEDWCTKGTIF